MAAWLQNVLRKTVAHHLQVIWVQLSAVCRKDVWCEKQRQILYTSLPTAALKKYEKVWSFEKGK